MTVCKYIKILFTIKCWKKLLTLMSTLKLQYFLDPRSKESLDLI